MLCPACGHENLTGADFIAFVHFQYNGVTLGTITDNYGNSPSALTGQSASAVVQFVIFLLVAVSFMSWYYIFRKVFAIKMPWARRPKVHNPDGSAFARYGAWLQHNFRWFGLLALGVILLLLAGRVASNGTSGFRQISRSSPSSSSTEACSVFFSAPST